MTTHEILHIIRNPWGWSEEEVRAARLAAADLIEEQAKDIETLNSVSKEMARTGMQIRTDLAEAKIKNIEQAAELAILKQRNPNGDRNPSPGDTCGRSCEGQAYRIEARTLKAEIDAAQKRIAELEADAMRYRFLRDNKHMDKWWSVAGPSDRCENIDADIDEAMKGQ